eukprot:7383046-Prymnesium_polylepis.1
MADASGSSCARVPNFATRVGTTYSMECGSSWEVDLRSDADCNKAGLGKCHPRYTLGWQTNEVQLYRDSVRAGAAADANACAHTHASDTHTHTPVCTRSRRQTSPRQEYIHAYCDVWKRGRVDMALARPIDRAAVRSAAEERRRHLFAAPPGGDSSDGRPTVGDYVEVVSGMYAGRRGELIQDDRDGTPYKMRFEDDATTSHFLKERAVQRASRGGAHGLGVLVLVLRGASQPTSLSGLPHTLGLLRSLHASGRYTLASYSRYAAVAAGGRANLDALFRGAPAAADADR